MNDEINEQSLGSETQMIEKEKYLRLAADFDNYQKQQSQMVKEFTKFAGQSVIAEMLDLADMVDAAVAHAPAAVKDEKSWFDGLVQMQKRFGEDMKKYGVLRIESVGKPFDPKTMEAVRTVKGGESQTVESEMRPGYTIHERVLRPARVSIYE